MFTGIIKHLGRFKAYSPGLEEISLDAPPPLASELEAGESLAVNGVCLSLIRKKEDILIFNLSEETLQKTTLGRLRPGERLNLELPLKLTSSLSGHLLTGHIDSMGRVVQVIRKKAGRRLTITVPRGLRPFFVPKGSVAVNGVSLTIAAAGPSSFEVEIIPITLEYSNLGELRNGEEVNIECDIIGKYVYNYLTEHNPRKKR